jgi:hypothetical protein
MVAKELELFEYLEELANTNTNNPDNHTPKH